jgi:hypothetical protein
VIKASSAENQCPACGLIIKRKALDQVLQKCHIPNAEGKKKNEVRGRVSAHTREK